MKKKNLLMTILVIIGFWSTSFSQPNNSEFQFNLALAYAGLGDRQNAEHHLSIAVKFSTTQKEQGIYATKLGRIQTARQN